MRPSRLAVPAVVLVALAATVGAPAVAQSPTPVTTITGSASISPTRAGTPQKPQSVNISIKGSISTSGPDGQNKPVVQKAVILFPKGSLYAGGKLPKGVKGKVTPKCSQSAMDNGLPADVCPKGSIVGTGSGNAWADTVKTKVKFTLVNGGADKVFAFAELTNPAVVQTPIPGKIEKLSGGKWAYRLTLVVPQELQVVAGVPISLIDLEGHTNAKNWLFLTHCPKNGKLPYDVTSFQDATAPAHFASFVKCTQP